MRSREAEAMDADDLDPAIYATVMADLDRVNALLLSARPTIGFVRRAMAGRRTLKLLDVGFGGGAMLRSIARWAAQHDIATDLVGIDLNPRSAPAAVATTPAELRITYRTGDYAALAGEGWDIIVSNFVAHHMNDDEIVAFLRFMEAESRRGWMVNDLHRLRLSYLGYPLLARAMRWHSMVRSDGTLSIARAFRRDEWLALLAAAGTQDARVVRRFPGRLCVERLR